MKKLLFFVTLFIAFKTMVAYAQYVALPPSEAFLEWPKNEPLPKLCVSRIGKLFLYRDGNDYHLNCPGTECSWCTDATTTSLSVKQVWCCFYPPLKFFHRWDLGKLQNILKSNKFVPVSLLTSTFLSNTQLPLIGGLELYLPDEKKLKFTQKDWTDVGETYVQTFILTVFSVPDTDADFENLWKEGGIIQALTSADVFNQLLTREYPLVRYRWEHGETDPIHILTINLMHIDDKKYTWKVVAHNSLIKMSITIVTELGEEETQISRVNGPYNFSFKITSFKIDEKTKK